MNQETNIQLYTKPISPSLSMVGKSIIESFQTEKILDLFERDKPKLEAEVADILMRAYNDLNRSPSQKEAKHLLDGVILNCINVYGSLKVGELRYAIEKGIRGEYGEFYGFSVVTTHKFIKAYKESEDRAEALRKQMQYEDSIKVKPLTPVDLANIDKEFWLNEIEKIKDFQLNKKLRVEFAINHFKIYEGEGLIILDFKTKEEYLERAKRVFLKTTDFEIKENRLLRNKINEGLKLTKEDKLALSPIACKLILEDEFMKADLIQKIINLKKIKQL